MLSGNVFPAVEVESLVIAHRYEQAVAKMGIEGDRNDIGAVAMAGLNGDLP